MSQPSDLVLFEVRDAVGFVILNSPPLNLVTPELIQQLHAKLDLALATADLRALIITGAGDRAFCAGSDIAVFPEFMTPGAVVPGKLGPENAAFSKVAQFPAPTIAVVKGLAFGGGLELASCCDFIVAEEGARLCLPEVKLGLIPGSGGPIRVTRRVGEARARELILLGEPIDAQLALAWGLVNRVAPRGQAMATAMNLVTQLRARSPAALTLCKEAIALAFDRPAEDAIALTLTMSDAAFSSPDAQEGLRAFLAKEAPQFGPGRLGTGASS